MMRKAGVILVLLAGAAHGQAVRYDGHRAVRTQIKTVSDLRIALALTDDVWSHRVGVGGSLDMRVTPAQFAALAVSGVPFTILMNDVQAQIDIESAAIARGRKGGGGVGDGPGWFEIYREYDEVRTFVQALAATHPGLASYQVIGQSLEGRDIFALKITGPGSVASRAQLLFNGGQHAREWVSVSTVAYIADALLGRYATDSRVRSLVDHLEFVVVPIVNPDGYVWSWTTERLWRKNRRDNGAGGGICMGVDTNRNWGFQWGGQGAATAVCNDTYRGASAFSEPETQVIRDFCNASPRLRTAIDFHSYSQLVMSPWGYTAALPPQPDAGYFSQLTSAIRDGIRDSGGAIYTSGPIYSTIYPASGTAVDWWYGGRGIYGLTVELRDTGSTGFNLPPEQIIPTGEENFAGIQALADYFMPVRFWMPAPIPTPLVPNTPTIIQVGIAPGSGVVLASGSQVVYARVGTSGPYSAVPLSLVAGNIYEAPLPAAPCGTPVQFYFEAAAVDGPTLQYPSAGAPLQGVPYQQTLVLADDMEADRGWTTVNGPSLATGAWERADPVATFNLNNDMANPEDDATASPGVNCFATHNGAVGGAAGLTDVDDDVTRLVSPVIDLSGAASGKVTYSRWVYSANGQPDPMIVEVSSDGGFTWVQVDRVTTTSGWKAASFVLPSGMAPTAAMRVRFSIADEPFDSLTEGAIDEVRVYALSCPAAACYANCDGSTGAPALTANDFQCFVNAFAASASYANCDGSSGVPALTANDFQCFVNAFANGCP